MSTSLKSTLRIIDEVFSNATYYIANLNLILLQIHYLIIAISNNRYKLTVCGWHIEKISLIRDTDLSNMEPFS
jgi:hypothetical protein